MDKKARAIQMLDSVGLLFAMWYYKPSEIYCVWCKKKWIDSLTHFGLVILYDNIDLGERWPR